MEKPEIELIQRWFDYNPESGELLRKLKTRDDPSNHVPLNKRLWFLGKRYPYSHIVWVVLYSRWPQHYIDHKDHNQLNFRQDNLREAAPSQNQHNKRMNNSRGKGVAYDCSVPRKKPWIARIMVKNKSIFLGSFETSEEASEAYRQAALKYHGEFACLD